MSENIAVIGMGRSGQSACTLALHKGAAVLAVDSRVEAPVIAGTRTCYGKDPSKELTTCDRIILSPGVPLEHPMLTHAKKSNTPIISELGYAASFLNIPILAITGTNGKSSTTWYTKQFLEQAGRTPFVGGNFGVPLCDLVLHPEQADVAVVEVSSYQLEAPGTFHPKAAVILNLTPDHLARHKTMENYAAHKKRIFAQQTREDYAITPREDPRIHPQGQVQTLWLGGTPGAIEKENTIQLLGSPCDGSLSLEGNMLFGDHNKQNIMAALLLCSTLGISASKLNIKSLLPLEHRLQHVPSSDGYLWINDSKATNVEATLAGIAGAPAPQILLLGGQGKNNADYTQLLPLIRKKVRHVICFGASRSEIQSHIPHALCCTTLEEAVVSSRNLAQAGDTILLSPACASFDAFANFAERGTYFQKIVQHGVVS